MTDLVVSKGLKGKQNKKKWNKNIDVSGLLNQIEKQNQAEARKLYAKPLIVEDTNKKIRQDLDPNRFKIQHKSKPKITYDNSYRRDNLLEDGEKDAWETPATPSNKKKQALIVPAIIKPSSGHSYNPKQEDIEKIVDEVIDYEKERPRKTKPIKKIKDVKIVPRARNKKVREQYLQAQQRKKDRQNRHSIQSMKKIKKNIEQKDRQIQKKIQEKETEKQTRLAEAKTGKVREGPKIGKKRYIYKQYVPTAQEINKKISKVGQSDQLVREQFDSIFRRGIIEPRTVKVHANKTKNIKVTHKFAE